MPIKQIRKWRILCVFALSLFLLCLSPAQGLGQKDQPGVRFHRKAQVQEGKKQEALIQLRDSMRFSPGEADFLALFNELTHSDGKTTEK